MKSTKMTFAEIVDYTDYEMRKPTDDEINTVLAYGALESFSDISRRNEMVTIDKITATINKIMTASEAMIRATAIVLDFKLIGKRLIVYHRLDVRLEDYHQLRNFGEMLGGKSMGDEMVNNASGGAQTHNHLTICQGRLVFHEDGKTSYYGEDNIDLCLAKTQTKAEKKEEAAKWVSQ